MGKTLAVFASGRGSNAEAIYKAIEAKQIAGTIAVIITDKPEAGIIEKAVAWQIPYHCLERTAYDSQEAYELALLQTLEPYGIDGILLAGYMRLLGKTFIDAYAHRILNIHPALLPSFPGLHAQRQALEAGVRYSGCTVHFVDTGMDTGPIIAQAVVPVLPDDTEESISARILVEEHRLYPQVVQLFCQDQLRIEGRHVHIEGNR